MLYPKIWTGRWGGSAGQPTSAAARGCKSGRASLLDSLPANTP